MLLITSRNCRRYSIDPKTGLVYLEKEWDLEEPDHLPTSTTLVLQCRDAGGLTSTETVVLYINDVNDHIPTVTYILPEGQDGLTFNVTFFLDSLHRIERILCYRLNLKREFIPCI